MESIPHISIETSLPPNCSELFKKTSAIGDWGVNVFLHCSKLRNTKIKVSEGYEPRYDVQSENGVLYEVKTSMKADAGNSFFVEYWNSGEKSGIQVSTSKYWELVTPTRMFHIKKDVLLWAANNSPWEQIGGYKDRTTGKLVSYDWLEACSLWWACHGVPVPPEFYYAIPKYDYPPLRDMTLGQAKIIEKIASKCGDFIGRPPTLEDIFNVKLPDNWADDQKRAWKERIIGKLSPMLPHPTAYAGNEYKHVLRVYKKKISQKYPTFLSYVRFYEKTGEYPGPPPREVVEKKLEGLFAIDLGPELKGVWDPFAHRLE